MYRGWADAQYPVDVVVVDGGLNSASVDGLDGGFAFSGMTRLVRRSATSSMYAERRVFRGFRSCWYVPTRGSWTGATTVL